MYLQTFDNGFLKCVFDFDLTSEDTNLYGSRSYAWKPHDIALLHERIAGLNS